MSERPEKSLRFWGKTGLHADEVKELRSEAAALKEVVAELMLENRLLKKSSFTDGEVEE